MAAGTTPTSDVINPKKPLNVDAFRPARYHIASFVFNLHPWTSGEQIIDGQTIPKAMYSYVERQEGDGETLIDVSVRDEAVVERLASDLKACGCVVKVYTEEQYDELKT